MEKPVPDFLFQLPEKNSAQEKSLGEFIDLHKDKCITYFPWLTGEVINFSGGLQTIDIIRKHGSMRMRSKDFCGLLNASERLIRTIELNGGDDGMLEIQSVSGFITSIRRYSVDMLINSNISKDNIILMTGVSNRTIQRAKHSNFFYE